MSGFAYGDNDNPDQILIDGDISKTLTKYATDPNYEIRQEFARTLSHILRQQPLEDILNHIHDFTAAILMVSEDKSPIVRTSLVEQIPYVFLQCHEHACPDLEHYLYDRLLQIVLNYLQDEECEVRRESFSALQLLLEKYVLDTKRIEEKVCPAIICPVHKIDYDSLGEFNINAITFMGRIAPIIGPQKTEELFLNHFISLCKSRINTVRRTCANVFPTISYVLGTTITEKNLLETFILLCEDVFWGVRKACAESIALISLICTLKCRKNRIASIVLKLAKDNNKWVVCATFKILGQIISSFADPCITGLAYSYNGELHITNPVDTDFREISDPQTLANYEHYLYLFANGDNNSNNDKLITSDDNENSKNDLSTNIYIDDNIIISNNNDDNNFNDETLSSEEIAQLIIESKTKLVKQINDAVCLKRSIFKNDVWNAWEYDDDHKNDCNNINYSKNNNDNKLDKNDLQNIFESTLGIYKNSNETTNNLTETTTSSTNTAVSNNNNCDESLSTPPSTTTTTTSTSDLPINDNNQIKSFKSDTWTNSNSTDNNNTFNSGDISNNINQNSNISETKGRRRTGLLVQAHSFWRKNTPTDLSSIIKKAINEQPQQQQSTIPLHLNIQQKNQISQNRNNNDKQHNDDEQPQPQPSPLQTPSINSKSYLTNLTGDEMSEIFESFNVLNHIDEITGLVNNCDDNKISNNIDDSNENHTSSIDIGFNSCIDPDENNKDDDSAFNEFNSYKYWHIDPELPLDDKIIENPDVDVDWRNLMGLMTYKTNRNNHIVKETTTTSSSSSLSKFKPPTNFQQNIVPNGILESYVTMVLHEEEEIKLNCAYNFPAVVLTIGKNNWHILKSLLQFLCDDIDWKVRKTIATSIDLLATILGKDIATKDLVPIYLGFFKDLDEVKIEAIRNFANFLKAIDQSKHKEILSNIGVCLRVDSKTNWRIKEDLAKQICLLIKMYNSINNHDSLLYLTSLTGFFLEDKVSCVREIAADAMSEIIVISNEKQREAIVKYFLVDEFANSDSWRKRQTFLIIFYKLIKCENPLIDLLHLIFSSMKRLSYDAVPNIRLLVAKNLVHLINIYEKRKETISEEIVQIVRRLRQDDDRDVRELFDSVDYLKIEEEEDILNNDTITTTISTERDEINSSEEIGDNEDNDIKFKNFNNRLHNPVEGESYSDILKAAPPHTSTSLLLSVPPINKNIELSKNVVDGTTSTTTTTTTTSNEQIETNT